jgi:hypothetical protein
MHALEKILLFFLPYYLVVMVQGVNGNTYCYVNSEERCKNLQYLRGACASWPSLLLVLPLLRRSRLPRLIVLGLICMHACYAMRNGSSFYLKPCITLHCALCFMSCFSATIHQITHTGCLEKPFNVCCVVIKVLKEPPKEFP